VLFEENTNGILWFTAEMGMISNMDVRSFVVFVISLKPISHFGEYFSIYSSANSKDLSIRPEWIYWASLSVNG
jgi:hypothetical protein